jgi:hypothetical protein
MVAPAAARLKRGAMARTINPRKRAAEKRFHHKIDIAVPVDGLGRRLQLMHEWCHDNVAADDWEEHGHSVPTLGEAPTQYARFCFMREAAVGRTDPMSDAGLLWFRPCSRPPGADKLPDDGDNGGRGDLTPYPERLQATKPGDGERIQ